MRVVGLKGLAVFRLVLIASVIVSVVFVGLIVLIESPLVRPFASLGRLVFTDYAKPNYSYTVDVFDLERGDRYLLPFERYQDIGFLSVIDAQHFYVSLCFAQNNPMFCSAPVSGIISPTEKRKFEHIKQFWKEDYGSPVWSPNGMYIAFSVVDKGTQNAFLFTGDTYVMNADGTNIIDLTPTENINGFDFAWSPDSQQIAFACSNTQYLCISDVEGSHLQKLIIPQYMRVQDIAWSPDGSQIVFSLSATDYLNSEVYLVNADGSNLHLLLESQSDIYSQPKWSPDGSKIIFINGMGGLADIYVIKSNGTELHNVSRGLGGNNFEAVWSPDSMNIAFFSWQLLKDGNVFLYVADASRGNPHKITDNSTFELMDVSAPELFWIP